MSIPQHFNTSDVLENGLVDIPDSPGEKEDPLANLQLNGDNPDKRAEPLACQQLNRESSPDFLGFSESVIKKSTHTQRGFTPSPLQSIVTSPSLLRVSQPRTSKSKASLVWKKSAKYFETSIKKEPEDEVINPTKATKKPNIGVKKIVLKKIKTENEENKNIKNAKNIIQNGKVKQERTVPKNLKEEVSIKKAKLVRIKQRHAGISSDRNKFRKTKINVKSSTSVNKGAIGLKKYVNTTNQHINNKRKKTGFRCETCGRAYKYLRGLRQHKKLECNVEPQFPCPYCPTRYRYRQNIREHVRNYHEAAFPKWYATHYVMPVFENIKS